MSTSCPSHEGMVREIKLQFYTDVGMHSLLPLLQERVQILGFSRLRMQH
jgi:hypothetical protein